MNGNTNQRQRPAVVVIGLDCITGLQAARVFAGRGVRVVGIATNPRHFCCRTRACSRIITADTAGPELIARLLELGPSFPEKPVLVPCTDNSVLQIARHGEPLREWFQVAQPAADIVEFLTDKVRFPHFAAEHGLPVPKSFTLASLTDAQRAADTVTYPAVLKPPVKTPRWLQHTGEKGVVVKSATQLLAAFELYSRWSATLLLQEWIPGPPENHFTCDAYFDANSQPLVTFTSHKLRQWPLETGVGSISQECDNPTVRREAIRLFQAAGFHGLAYVEMKRHEETGEYLIVEPNVGRPTGRSTCAEGASVEILYTMYCDLVGLPLPANRQQQFTGRKWIYWKRDLRAAWHTWRRGELTPANWWRSIRGPKTCAVFSWSDPVPFLADCLRTVTKSAAPAPPRGNSAASTTQNSGSVAADAAPARAIAAVSPTATSHTVL